MNDFNFFEPYILPPKKTDYEKLVWFALYGLVLIALITVFTMQSRSIASLETDVSQLKNGVKDPLTLSKLQTANESEAVSLVIDQGVAEVALIDAILMNRSQVDITVVSDISARVPEFVYVSAMTLSLNQMVITGYSDSYESVAQFQFQLKASPSFSDVFIQSIVEDQGNYLYTLNGLLKAKGGVHE